jgi:hypothetical protein
MAESAMAQTAIEPGERRLSFEEFLARADEDAWTKWIGGEVRILSPASNRHQATYFRRRAPGGQDMRQAPESRPESPLGKSSASESGRGGTERKSPSAARRLP